MKAKFLLLMAFLPIIIGCTGGTPPPPFDYQDNTRIVIEGKLIDVNLAVMPNQLVQLYALNGGTTTVMIHQTTSNSQGEFYLSSPKGRYALFIVFPEKNVSSVSNNSNLIKQFQYMGLGYLSGTYYNFNQIVLIN